jgi:hypothetical protein
VVFSFFLDLTFATCNPLNGLAQENPSEVLKTTLLAFSLDVG